MRRLFGGHRNKSRSWTTVSIMRKTGGDVGSPMGPVPEATQRRERRNRMEKSASFCLCKPAVLHSDVLIHYKLSCLD